MRRVGRTLLALLLACAALRAQDAGGAGSSRADVPGAALADEAARAFAAARWDDASAALAALLARDDAARGLVLADLGAVAFRSGRDAEATLFYERALLHRPRDTSLRDDLAAARRRLGPRAPSDETFAASWRALFALLTPREHLLLAAALQAVGLALVVAARARPGLRRTGRALVLVALLLAARLLADALAPSDPRGVVLAPSVALRAEPDDAAAASATLRAGDEVVVLARRDGWASVRRGDAHGWLSDDAVGVVDE